MSPVSPRKSQSILRSETGSRLRVASNIIYNSFPHTIDLSGYLGKGERNCACLRSGCTEPRGAGDTSPFGAAAGVLGASTEVFGFDADTKQRVDIHLNKRREVVLSIELTCRSHEARCILSYIFVHVRRACGRGALNINRLNDITALRVQSV